MKSRLPLILGVCVLTLAACSWSKTPQNDTKNPDSAGDPAVVMEENGVAMSNGVMLTVEDGAMSRMDKDVTYANGTTVKVDGTVTLADGTVLVLPEGMMVTVDGELRLSDSYASIQDPAPIAESSAIYTAYSDAVAKDGKTKVLFFHAAWCPECKKADATLTSWFPSEDFTRSVYKVDYDTAKELKAKYGVIYQHTFVVVDGQGVKISSAQGPTEVELKALLK
ncbi:MAG: Uncharacterized protein Greene101449_1322 [Candidatus Peregrinibacteria bacterium Greene1014_49]|nr:MAG: Uncharacterized protein Greene101449_1322 [Candidatus Peregrinibacteria bacterium Greene1014_49]